MTDFATRLNCEPNVIPKVCRSKSTLVTQNRSLLAPVTRRPPSIGYVLDRWTRATNVVDGNQIKPILVSRASVTQHPHGGHPRNVALFAPADRLEGGSADRGAAGLHLDKRDRPAFPDYQVEIVPPKFEAMRLDRPAARREEGYGDSFSMDAEQLASVFPFLDWNEAAGVGHGPG